MEGGFQSAYLGHHTDWISSQQLGRLAPLDVELLYMCMSVHLFLAQPSLGNLQDFQREAALVQQGTVRASVAFCRNPISLTATGVGPTAWTWPQKTCARAGVSMASFYGVFLWRLSMASFYGVRFYGVCAHKGSARP